MSLLEFDIIKHYFSQLTPTDNAVCVGVGDDAAVLNIPADQQLLLSIDTLVSGVHFPNQTPSNAIGHKALAVSLSDIAAMGGEPRWLSLALTLPQANTQWLQGFSTGLLQLAQQHQLALVGGDTTQGPLSISTQVHGLVPHGQAVLRSGAKVGDLVCVTGTLGDAGMALQALNLAVAGIKPPGLAMPSALAESLLNRLVPALYFPQPRVAEGMALRGHVRAMIDISDGLAADLGHILTASDCGATIYVDQLPISDTMTQGLQSLYPQHWQQQAWQLALNAGDDYELCFTIAPENKREIDSLLAQFECGYHVIGAIEATPGLRVQTNAGDSVKLEKNGYQHFV